MLRQSAFIFLLFLLPFSVLLGHPSGQADVQSAQDDVQQWNLPEGAVRRLGRGSISEVAYSPDGGWLAVTGGVGIWIYEAHTLNPLKLLTGHREGVKSVSFSPDGQTIASGSPDNTVRLWNVETGRNIKTLTGYIRDVHSMHFSPDGSTLISGGSNGAILEWDVRGFRAERLTP